jgi:FixJ family two-component response regulator
LPHQNLVLVVDDDLGMLRGIQRLLRLHAYEPILFSSAEAFKSHTDFGKAVCVILDINLNDGSGIELRHGLKAAGVSTPVIYITGNDNPAVREAALDSGCIAFLTKPFSVQELIEPLKRAGRQLTLLLCASGLSLGQLANWREAAASCACDLISNFSMIV